MVIEQIYLYFCPTSVCQRWKLSDMETFSALLALCKGNPLVIGGLFWQSQRRGVSKRFFDNDNDNDNESMFIVKVVQNQNQIINNASTWYIT